MANKNTWFEAYRSPFFWQFWLFGYACNSFRYLSIDVEIWQFLCWQHLMMMTYKLITLPLVYVKTQVYQAWLYYALPSDSTVLILLTSRVSGCCHNILGLTILTLIWTSFGCYSNILYFTQCYILLCCVNCHLSAVDYLIFVTCARNMQSQHDLCTN